MNKFLFGLFCFLMCSFASAAGLIITDLTKTEFGQRMMGLAMLKFTQKWNRNTTLTNAFLVFVHAPVAASPMADYAVNDQGKILGNFAVITTIGSSSNDIGAWNGVVRNLGHIYGGQPNDLFIWNNGTLKIYKRSGNRMGPYRYDR